ncbi:MAG: ribonuclease HII, partial [Candidatus Electrothrix sp. AS4_5]|nr:ribonuclease HII [Candidatus Electrothrix gigas]
MGVNRRALASQKNRINILQASLLAMQRAVQDCTKKSDLSPDLLLVDGTFQVP